MRRLGVTISIAAVLAAMAPTVPASAGGDCVTRREFRRVDIGMRQAQVRRIFGTPGSRLSQHGAREEYAYDGCTGAVVFVNYRDNRVTGKQFVLGE